MARIYLDADVDSDLDHRLTVLGHDVLTTYQVGRRRAGDEEQLAYAASLERILITHNSDDFRLLQRAWRHWGHLWRVEPRPVHFRILAPRQPPHQSVEHAAEAINDIIRSSVILTNHFYEWIGGRGWVQDG